MIRLVVISHRSQILKICRRNNTAFLGDHSGEQASSFIGGVALESTRQIDQLIDDLNKLRQRLEDEGNRLQRDFADHSSFSKSVIQLTQIVSDGMAHVKSSSSAAGPVTETHIPPAQFESES